ncbi:MAG: hypothetical protein ACRYG4_14385 [Janthinobacterium lividum]
MTKRGWAVTLLASMILGACGVAEQASADKAESPKAERFLDWHDKKLATDAEVGEALNGANGADFPKAVAALRAADRPPSVKDLQLGELIVSYYNDPSRSRPPVESLVDGLALLERASLGDGEGAKLAPERLARIFETGVGPANKQILAAKPVIANCWRRVHTGESVDRAACIKLRTAP